MLVQHDLVPKNPCLHRQKAKRRPRRARAKGKLSPSNLPQSAQRLKNLSLSKQKSFSLLSLKSPSLSRLLPRKLQSRRPLASLRRLQKLNLLQKLNRLRIKSLLASLLLLLLPNALLLGAQAPQQSQELLLQN